MEAKHTPGPWYAAHRGNRTFAQGTRVILDADDHPIAETSSRMFADIEEANIALIAAAPDMYEALVAVVADHDERVAQYPDENSHPHRITVMEAARAAIAKAEGR